MNEKVALITGASDGIGQATAIRLSKDFGKIVLVGRNELKLNKTAALVRTSSSEVLIIPADLRIPEAAASVIDSISKKFGKLDVLLNIAGAVPQESILQMTDQQWTDGEQMKLHGARRLTMHAWDALKKSQGSVIFMSGNSAIAPKAAFAAVGVINAAISALSKAFADQGLVDNVRVNCVMPGAVMTNRRKQFLDKWSTARQITPEEAAIQYRRSIGISRFGKPEEIAELLAFLISPSATWITGATFRIDGGEITSI